MLVVNNVLVVCVGNICRSPLAAYLLHQGLTKCTVESAGLGAVIGSDMDVKARSVALARGHQVPKHQARQLIPAMCQKADLILVMESTHRDAVAHLYPPARGKTLLLAHGLVPDQIIDPYRKTEKFHVETQQQIEAACAYWIRRLAC